MWAFSCLIYVYILYVYILPIGPEAVGLHDDSSNVGAFDESASVSKFDKE